MISPLSVRQGFSKSLSGVNGTSIQSAYTKPVMDFSRAQSNFSWLPYPYGPLPDQGPWSNDKEETPTPDAKPPGGTGDKEDPLLMYSGGFVLVVVVVSAWFLVKYLPK